MTEVRENDLLFCTFRAADRWFGVPVQDVKEVTTQTTCTRIPHAPREVAGYVNIRGHIFMALDPRALLGLETTATPENRLILFKPRAGASFGLMADDIGDIISVHADQVEEFGTGAHEHDVAEVIGRRDVISRVCRLPTGLLAILEPRRFLKVVQQSISATE